MPTEPEPTTTTLTRWAVLAAAEPIKYAAYGCYYASREDADTLRRILDRKYPEHAPYRVVRVEMTITEEATA